MKQYIKSSESPIEYNNYIDPQCIRDIESLARDGDGCYDEWGLIQCISGDIGVEYNLCIDNTTGEMIDESAFYAMHRDPETGYWDDDTAKCFMYSIDFNNPSWTTKVEQAAKDFLAKVQRGA